MKINVKMYITECLFTELHTQRDEHIQANKIFRASEILFGIYKFI